MRIPRKKKKVIKKVLAKHGYGSISEFTDGIFKRPKKFSRYGITNPISGKEAIITIPN